MIAVTVRIIAGVGGTDTRGKSTDSRVRGTDTRGKGTELIIAVGLWMTDFKGSDNRGNGTESCGKGTRSQGKGIRNPVWGTQRCDAARSSARSTSTEYASTCGFCPTLEFLIVSTQGTPS